MHITGGDVNFKSCNVNDKVLCEGKPSDVCGANLMKALRGVVAYPGVATMLTLEDGIYTHTEPFLIEHSVKLIAENPDKAVLDGNDERTVLKVDSWKVDSRIAGEAMGFEVTLSGLEITSGYTKVSGPCLEPSSDAPKNFLELTCDDWFSFHQISSESSV